MSLRIVCDGCESQTVPPDRLKQFGWAFARLPKVFGGAEAEVHLCATCLGLALQLLKTHKATKAVKP